MLKRLTTLLLMIGLSLLGMSGASVAADGCSIGYGYNQASVCIKVNPYYGDVASTFRYIGRDVYLTMKQCDGNGQNCGNHGTWYRSLQSTSWTEIKPYVLYHTYRTHGTWKDYTTYEPVPNAVSPLSCGC